MKTLVLTQRDVRTVLTMALAMPAVERAFDAHGRGEAIMPPKVYLRVDHHEGDFRAMPAYLEETVAVKWVSAYPENPSRHGLPTVSGLLILSDPSTAAPRAVMDATLLTHYRTGAAAALATRILRAEPPRTLGIIGCGVLSRTLIDAHQFLYPDLHVLTADVSRSASERLADEFNGHAVSIEEAAACEVVCTATPSRRPVLRRAWLSEGAHINAMGADAKGKQELEPQILLEACVVVDDLDQATESGEVNVPISLGMFSAEQIHATLGELLTGRAKVKPSQYTVFDSTGLAVQDAALARAIYRAARDSGVGKEIDFFVG